MEYDMYNDMESAEWFVTKVRDSKTYAQNLYAAMCNMRWQKVDVMPILIDEFWTCSWRSSGGLVAKLRNCGEDYMDWYCSGIKGSLSDEEFHNLTREEQEDYLNIKNNWQGEGYVAGQVSEDFAKIGWKWKEYEDKDMV